MSGTGVSLADLDSDDRYMDPPSETYGVERDQIVQRLHAETEAQARSAPESAGLFGASLKSHAPSAPAPQNAGDQGLFGATLHNAPSAAAPQRAGDQGLFGDTLHSNAPSAPVPHQTGSQGLFGSTLRAHTAAHLRQEHDRYQREPLPPRPAGTGLFQAALDHTVQAQPVAAPVMQPQPAMPPPQHVMPPQPVTTRPPPPAPPSRAPEAWRDEVRRMVERAPSKGASFSMSTTQQASDNGRGPGGSSLSSMADPGSNAPSSGPGPGPGGPGIPGSPGGPGGPGLPGSAKPSLRLKLDAYIAEDAYRAPKSPLPKVLIWLVILGLLGGGAALFAQSQGGVAAVVQRFTGGAPTTPTLEQQQPTAAPTQPPASAPQQPAAAAEAQPPTAAPAQPAAAAPAAPAAQPTAAAPAAQPAAAAPAQPAAAQPAAAQPAAAQPSAAAKPKEQPAATKPASPPPAAAKPATPKPARPVRPQNPVVKVRPIESAPAASEPASPEPPDIPYVPMPGDPPAPEPR